MSTIGHDNDASLADFVAGWDTRLQENEQLPFGVAVLELTSFGERPVPSTHLAEVLGRPVSEAEARAQGHCSTGAPAEDTIVRVKDGWSPSSTRSAQTRLPGGCSRSVTACSA